MIEIVILYILNRYDSSIYRISKIINEFFFAYLKSSFGTISPALKRLEKMGCVEFIEKMSDGGMKTKIYSITPTGKKHLSYLLLNYEQENPFYIVNEVKILLYCSSVLSVNELIEFKNNIKNILELYKINLEKNLKNEYIELDELQKNTVLLTLSHTDELLKLI